MRLKYEIKIYHSSEAIIHKILKQKLVELDLSIYLIIRKVHLTL